MMDFVEIALRLAGGFYAVVMFLALKPLATSMLIDASIAAFSTTDAETRVENLRRLGGQRLRTAVMVAAVLTGGLAGAALALMLELSLGLLASAILIFAALLVAGPLYFDRFDPPTPGERRRSWFAVAALAAVFALAYGLARSGRMIGLGHAPAWVVGLFIVAAAAFLARAISLWRAAAVEPRLPEFDAPETEADASEFARCDDRRFVLQLVHGGSGLIDAESDEPVSGQYPLRELTVQDRADLRNWQDDFERAIDPDDPRRARIADDALRGDIEARGRALHDRLSQKLGGRIAYAPEPRPTLPIHAPRRLILRAQTREGPLVDGDQPDATFTPATLALSLRLGDDLVDWLMDYDQADFPAARPPGRYDTPNWKTEEIAAFDARGLALAQRVASELAATGRGGVRVAYTTIAGDDVEIDP